MSSEAEQTSLRCGRPVFDDVLGDERVCGTLLPLRANFCPTCGRHINESQRKESQRRMAAVRPEEE